MAIDLALVCVAFLSVLASSAEAVVLSGEPGSGRATPGEPIYGVNHDGVGAMRISLEEGPLGGDELFAVCSGALITDRHVLTVAHCLDVDEDDDAGDWFDDEFPASIVMRFELAGGVVDIPILPNVQTPPDWFNSWADLAVVELAESAPTAVPRYPLYGRTDEVGQPMVLVGYGVAGHGSTGYEEFDVDGS